MSASKKRVTRNNLVVTTLERIYEDETLEAAQALLKARFTGGANMVWLKNTIVQVPRRCT